MERRERAGHEPQAARPRRGRRGADGVPGGAGPDADEADNIARLGALDDPDRDRLPEEGPSGAW